MIRTTLTATGVCALVTAALSAQTAPTPSAAPGRMDAPQNVTMTGCLKPWDASTMGAPGAAATTGDRAMTGAATTPQFVLTNAVNGAATPPATPGAAGTPMPPSSGGGMGAHNSYLLKAQTPSVDFASHAGHRVELTGTVAVDTAGAAGTAAKPGAMGTTAPGATPGAPATPTTSAGASDMARQHAGMAANTTFTVTALKMIDKTCS